jgi:predicted nucleic acid-binding protein
MVRRDETKAQKAIELLKQGPVLSVLVLNELANALRKKLGLEWEAVRTALEFVTENAEVLPLSISVHAKAMEIAEANLIGVYDACIVAAADLSGCDVLYTQEMSHGQRLGRVLIQNPFLAA